MKLMPGTNGAKVLLKRLKRGELVPCQMRKFLNFFTPAVCGVSVGRQAPATCRVCCFEANYRGFQGVSLWHC